MDLYLRYFKWKVCPLLVKEVGYIIGVNSWYTMQFNLSGVMKKQSFVVVHEWSRVLTCIDGISNSLFVRIAPLYYPVFLVFGTGEVFQKTFSFHYRRSPPCWTKERRCQHLVGGHHTLFLQNVFEGTAKLRRLSRRHLRCKWQSFLFLSADNAKLLDKSALHCVTELTL